MAKLPSVKTLRRELPKISAIIDNSRAGVLMRGGAPPSPRGGPGDPEEAEALRRERAAGNAGLDAHIAGFDAAMKLMADEK